MRLEWIDDLLAVLKAGSLNRAAEQRYLTQPAFSRRMRTIEDYVGIELLDRTRKPAQLRRTVLEQQERLEKLSIELHDLLHDLRRRSRKTGKRVVIVSQHAISVSIAPVIVKRMSTTPEVDIQLWAANWDECLAQLLIKRADLALIYRMADEQLPHQDSFLDVCNIRREKFIPIFATDSLNALNRNYRKREIPVVTYPNDVFFGKVMSREIFPKMHSQILLDIKAETSFSLTSVQLAQAGIGVAWVPLPLVSEDIRSGVLTDLSHLFGSADLLLSAVRTKGLKSSVERDVWNVIDKLSTLPPAPPAA